MPKVKKTLPFLIFLCFYISVHAQSYVNAYYVSMSGDTIRGTALQGSFTQMSKEIRFKPQNGQEIVLKPKMARSVWLSPDYLFESKNIHFRNLSDELNGQYFLRCLVRADRVSLMKFECDQYVGLYMDKKDSVITPLLLLRDFLVTDRDNFKKRRVENVDTVSYENQIKNISTLGSFRIRKPYMATLSHYFDNCDVNIVNSPYQLTTDDMIKAFTKLAKCNFGGKISTFFKESSWKPSVGLTVSNKVWSSEPVQNPFFSLGTFFYLSDLHDGMGIGVNTSKIKSDIQSSEPIKGSLLEVSLLYNRKLLLREKYNIYGILSVSYFRTYGFKPTTISGIQVNLNGQKFYSGALGMGFSYQVAKNNYINCQLIDNINNLSFNFSEITHLGRLQIQYEHRF